MHQVQAERPDNGVPDVQVLEEDLTDQAGLSVSLGDQCMQRLHQHGNMLVVALGHCKADILVHIQGNAVLRGRQVKVKQFRANFSSLEW